MFNVVFKTVFIEMKKGANYRGKLMLCDIKNIELYPRQAPRLEVRINLRGDWPSKNWTIYSVTFLHIMMLITNLPPNLDN